MNLKYLESNASVCDHEGGAILLGVWFYVNIKNTICTRSYKV